MDEYFRQAGVLVRVLRMSNGNGRNDIVHYMTRLQGGCFPAVLPNVLARDVARSVVNEGTSHGDRFLCFVLFNDFTRLVRRSVCGNDFRQYHRVRLIVFSRVKIILRPITREMGGQNLGSTGAVVRP